MNINQETFDLLKSKLKSISFDLIDISLNKKDEILTIVVDKDGFISLDELSKVSGLISNLLEGTSYSTDYYGLDVTTLGIEKEITLDKLPKYLNQLISITLKKAVEKFDSLKGEVKEIKKDSVIVEVNLKGRFKKFEVPFDSISKINLAVKF